MSTETQKYETFKGRCACKAITYEADIALEKDGSLPPLALCHCTLCHILFGSFSTNIRVPLLSTRITSSLQPKVKDLRPNHPERALPIKLCPECGVMIWSEPANMPGFVALKTGTLERCAEFRDVGIQLYAGHRSEFLAEPLTRKINDEEGCFGMGFPGTDEMPDHLVASA